MSTEARSDLIEAQLRWRELPSLSIRYRPGELVYHTGSYAAGAGMLLSGVIVDQPDPASTKRSETFDLELIGPGDLFGVEALGSPPLELHQTSGRALTVVEVAFVERAVLRDALSADRSLGNLLLAHVAGRFLRLRTPTRVPGRSPRDASQAKHHLAACLLQLAQMCGTPADDQQRWVRLPKEINARTLSSLLGVSAGRITQLLSNPDLTVAEPPTKSDDAGSDRAAGLLVAVDKLLLFIARSGDPV